MMITHGHITVNGRLVNIPSYLTRPGDTIRVKGRPKSLQLAEAARAEARRQIPDFLSVAEGAEPQGHVLRMPEAADASIPVQTHLIVELCSK
jgi:small subunit ribosomal protein S4